MSDAKKTPSPSGGDGATPVDCVTGECPVDVSVEIKNEAGGKPCESVANGKTCKFKAIGAPSGGTYAWTATGKVSIAGSASSEVVEVRGDSVSGAVNDSKLKVKYSKAGKSAEAEIALTVAEVRKIKVKIKATPPMTARMGNAPADHVFESVETAANWDAAKTLVLVRAALQDVELEGEIAPAALKLAWKAERASDDDGSLGAGLPSLTPDAGDDKKAKLKTDETGSFLIRAFVDCDGDGNFGSCDAFKVLQVCLVRPTLVADNSVTHVGHIAPVVAGGSIRLRTGSFNIAAPATEAIHMNATLDVLSGGPDGRRLLDRVFAGWVNNERLAENILASYAGGHTRFSVFTSNSAAATGPGTTFIPGDPAPVLVPPPVLDSGRPGAGTGGDTATLTRSRIQSRTNQPKGERWIVEAIDSPGDSAPLDHPGHPGNRLTRYHFELNFRACLSFWTNQDGVSGATVHPANRVYAALLTYDWTMLGEWTVSAAGVIGVATAMAVTISGSATHKPCLEDHNAATEVRAPTGLSLLANNAQT